jgi:hypothetical protein
MPRQQLHRVEIRVATADTPVQATAARAAGIRLARDVTDQLTAPDLFADVGSRGYRLIGHVQPAVADRDHAPPGQFTGVDDHPYSGGDNRFARVRRKVDPAIARQPWLAWRRETRNHGQWRW